MHRRQRALAALFLLFLLRAVLVAQEPRRSDKFSGPPRDPPSRDFDFLHLRLECSFDWENEAVEATVTHTLKAFRDGTRTVDLDAIGIEVRSAALSNGQALGFETLPEKLRVDLGHEVKRGETITLAISYRARPRQGVYFRKPDASYPDNPKQIWTQGEAEEARHWIPCFDHPSDKLTTEVIVTAPKPMTVISNGRLVSVEPKGPDAQVFHWLEDKPHATYLIVVVVGELAVWKGDAGGIPLAAYVQKRHEPLAARSFELTADMMAFFGEKTGVRYPWHRYDQICVSGFLFGGMENTSATTLNENTLHDERAALDVSSLGLVAHELAHQWFGDLVTCKDWGDVWLNESFATFFENLYTEHHLGLDEGAYERYEEGNSYKAEDRNEYRRRLSTRSWRGPENLFDRHAYPKGARVLSMLRHVLGDDSFFAGVKRYLEKHAYQPVETSDFRVALEEATGVTLGWFFDEWLHSGGHPSFKVSSRWDSREKQLTVDVEQTQKVDDLTPLFRMPVVLAVTQPSGTTQHRVWVSEKKHAFTFPAADRPRMVRFDPGDWILKDLQFERSREDLLYQLERDPDVLGRHEAAEVLKPLAGDEAVEAALLARLDAEPFWGVRLQIVTTLSDVRGESLRKAFMARFAKEPKARVRGQIVRTLAEMGGPDLHGFLREAVAKDPSYLVVADALRALGRVAKREAQPDALSALGRESHNDVIREAAVDVLAAEDLVPGEAQAETLKRLADLFRPGSSPSLRGAVLRALGRVGKGNESAFQLLTRALDDSNHFVRAQAIEALGELGDRRAISILEARKNKERPVVLRSPLEAIRRAISRLEGKADLRTLEAEIRRLRERSERLEERVEAMEKRGKAERF